MKMEGPDPVPEIPIPKIPEIPEKQTCGLGL
jgi:hypothetical protein